mgnify:CR=1 FL=1
MPLSKRQRAELERQIAEALAEAWAGRADDVLAALGNPPDFARLPPELWAQFDAETRAAVEPILIAARLRSAEQLARSAGVSGAVNWGLINEHAAAAARRYTFDLVRGITDTTRTALRQKVAAFAETPAQDLKTLGEEIGRVFGPVRGEMIATTEVTRAAVQGTQDLIAEIRSMDPQAQVVDVWRTSNDELVCPVCAPLNGVRRSGGVFRHPDGTSHDAPPAHPRCRCDVATEIVTSLEA